MSEDITSYDEAAAQAVELANRLADADQQADIWDIADGVLAGAIQYWLYSRQPCGDPTCTDCEPLSTAELRLKDLQKLVEQLARTSEYFHASTDTDAGHA
jgi:hypothetical protein